MHIIKPNPKNVNAVLYILISKNKKKETERKVRKQSSLASHAINNASSKPA